MDNERRALPEGWVIVKLAKVFKLSSGKPRPSEISDSPNKMMKFPIYGGNGILGYSDQHFVDKEVIVIGRVGEYCGCVHNAPKFSWISDNALYTTEILKPEIELYYLSYYLNYLNLNRFKNKFGQSSITQEIIYSNSIPIPPISIQRRIVLILEKAEETKRLRAQADELTNRLLQSVFLEMFGNPITNRKKWETIKLGDLCKIRRGASPRPIDKFLGGTIPWVKIGDGTKGNDIYIEDTEEKIIEEGVNKSVLLKKGSLIFANCGVSLGFARILKIDGCIHDGWLSLEDFNPKINKIYILKLINNITTYLRKFAPDGTQPNLNTTIMKNFEIPVPPISLQNKFADIVEKVEFIRQSQNQSKQQIEDLFSALMQKAFQGEI